MAFTGLATKVYKDPATIQWANSIQGNDDYLFTASTKGWVIFDGSGVASAIASFNVASITRTGTGDYVISWATDFSTTGYVVFGLAAIVGEQGLICLDSTASVSGVITSAYVNINATRLSDGALFDSPFVGVAAAGSQ